MDLSLLILTRNSGLQACRALGSLGEHARELVVVDTGSDDGSLDMIEAGWDRQGPLHVVHYTPITNPEGFLLDEPQTFAGDIAGPFTGQTFLADFGAARRLGWARCTSKYATYLDSDDVWYDSHYLPDLVAAMERVGAAGAGLPYIYRRDAAGIVLSQQITLRLAVHARSRWTGRIHERLSLDGPAAAMDNYGHVEDLNDALPAGASRVLQRNFKVLYRMHLDGLCTAPLDRFNLGMEARQVDPDLAQNALAKACLDENLRPELRARAACERGFLYESAACQSTGEHGWTKPEALYHNALLVLPGYPEALYALARLARKRGLHDRCLELIAEGDRSAATGTFRDQHSPDARGLWPSYEEASARLALGQRDEAARLCRILLTARPHEDRFQTLAQECGVA